MRTSRSYSLLIYIFISAAVSTSAWAQYSPNNMDRLDRLERDLNLIQRQISRTGSDTSSNVPSSAGNITANTQVRITAMEEELRTLRGIVEENSHGIKKLSLQLERFQKDVDYRFQERNASDAPRLQQENSVTKTLDDAAYTSTESSNIALPEPMSDMEELLATEAYTGEVTYDPASPTTGGDGVLRNITPDTVPTDVRAFAEPREHYNYAFRLLNQTEYNQAANYFQTFIASYPKDPLIGNAYYWLGETYYINREYLKAANQFRQGFEALPGGPKAPDNLLKLAMSLSALSRNDDACIVYDQLISKYADSTPSLVEKAKQERSRIGCSR